MKNDELFKAYLFYSAIFLIPVLKLITPVLLVSAWSVFRYHAKLNANASSIFLAHLGNAVRICIEFLVTVLIGFIVLSMNEFTEEQGVRPILMYLAGSVFMLSVIRAGYKTIKGMVNVKRNCSPFNSQKNTEGNKPELLI